MNDSGNNTIKWLFTVPGKKNLSIVVLIIVQALHGASGVLYALLLRNVVDAAVAGDHHVFWLQMLLVVLLVIGQLALRAILRWLNELSKSSLENIFKTRLMRTLLRKDYLPVSAVHSGEWLNRLTNDTVVVANGYVEILPGLAGMIVKLISALVMIIALEPRFAVILIPGGILLIFFTWLFRRVLKRLHKNVQETDGRLRIFLQERIISLLMIRSFASEEKTAREAEEWMQGHQDSRMRKNRFSNLCNIGFGAAMNGMYLLGVGWCGYGILIGTISFGTLTAITQLISQIQTPFANITGYLPRYYTMLASAERLMEAEQFPEMDSEAALEREMVRDFYDHRLSAFGLKDAVFTYYAPAEKVSRPTKVHMPVVLNQFSLEIRKGEIVAFTGQSGCGKSTVMKLLMCVYQPDSGERYYIDTAGNKAQLTSAWRRLFAYVPQGNQLMSGTVREVVSFAEPAKAMEEDQLRKSLRIACADEFVGELEQGIDTLLGERGTGLSEGQMQRLAIARAVFSESPILLLDEATSALDTGTEKRLLGNLQLMTDKTVIIVTHRPAVLTICDRVLEFTENGIVEKGRS